MPFGRDMDLVLAFYSDKWIKSTFLRWHDDREHSAGEAASASDSAARTFNEPPRLAEVLLHGWKKRSVPHVLIDDRGRGLGALLREAAQAGEGQLVDALLDAGISPLLADSNATTPILLAAEHGHAAVCRRLLQEPEIARQKHLPDMHGQTPLQHANRAGPATVRVFDPSPSDLDVERGLNAGVTDLMMACRTGHLGRVGAMIDAVRSSVEQHTTLGPVKARSRNGCTALSMASEEGHTKVVEKLLPLAGPPMGHVLSNGESPLMLAALNGYPETMLTLLSHANGCAAGGALAVLRHKCARGRTPLMAACRSGALPAVELLLDAADDDDHVIKELITQVDNAGSTALMAACVRGNPQICQLLLLKGTSNVDARKHSPQPGVSALSIAVRGRHVDVVGQLLRARAAPDAPSISESSEGTSILSEACGAGNENIAHMLINAHAPLNVNKSGMSPLGFAAMRGHAPVVRFLIEKRADITHARNDGLTPLMLACRPGHAAVVHELLKVLDGRDINAKRAKDGATALILACRNGEDDVASMLMHRGASLTVTDNQGVTAMMALKTHVDSMNASKARITRSRSLELLKEMQRNSS